MATQDGSEHPEEQGPHKREPLSESHRKRLQKCFEHAGKQMGQDNYDYASELFTQCVSGDPTNLSYAQSFLGNLQKKYGNNKKGSSLAQFKERGARGAIKKAVAQSEWDDVIENGIAVLKVNPWDVPTLTAMATAAAAIATEADTRGGPVFNDCELFYLKAAYEANSKDPEVCRLVAIALGKRRQFDQSIAFWHKVEQIRPGDEEAARAISSLAVEKTIKQTQETSQAQAVARGAAIGGAQTTQQDTVSPEDQLKRKIRMAPNEVQNYLDLAELYLNADHHKDAVEILTKAYKVSNNDPDVWEKLEDAGLRDLRQQIIVMEKKVKEGGGDDVKAQFKQLKREAVKKDLGIWKARCRRYPNNLTYKYETGLRLQRLGEYNEAIKEFQVARNDPRKKGVCMLALGECFEQIKQYRLAGSHYESAIEEIPDRDPDNKKKSLYRAGKLAYNLNELDTAEKHLAALAAMDFSYRDVSELLDKISKKRQN